MRTGGRGKGGQRLVAPDLSEYFLVSEGKKVHLLFEMTAVDRNIFYKTTGDGKPLQVEEKKATELKA